MKSSDTRWIAHRGLNTEATENTKEAFRLAGEYGFWGAECDVRETKHDADGNFNLVISHDDTFERVFGVNRKISDMTEEEIRADKKLKNVCFFQDYLDVCKEYDMAPVVELKSGSWSSEGIARVVDMIYEIDEGNLLSKTNIISFTPSLITRVKNYDDSNHSLISDYILLIKEDNFTDSIENIVSSAADSGFTGIGMYRKLMTGEIADTIRDNNLKLNIWTYSDTDASNSMMYNQIIKKNYNVYSATINGKLFSR